MWCHLLLATPLLGLGLFFILPFSWALVIYALLVIASLLLYYKIIESMHAPVMTGSDALVGQVVTTNANGSVQWRGEWWTAEPRFSNQRVRIVRLRGMRLEVEPMPNVTEDAI